MQIENSYAALGMPFCTTAVPIPVATPSVICTNKLLARQLGIDTQWLDSEGATLIFGGNAPLPGSQPVATAYAGHQFGHWNPRMGDGRAILLGELITPDGHRVDLQLKGAGPTPFSRSGDGRSALGPVLREYLVSEAMHVLGVPTTRALAAVSTGENVYRETALPGAILTRVASSHLRVGTMQYIAASGDTETLRTLVNYVIDRHYPGAAQSECPPLALLECVIAAQARLVAQWQLLGFIHGVMNTDNMLLCGETVDYGPCAFMEAFDPNTVFSSIDQQGRYAWARQPHMAHWNLAALANALLHACDSAASDRNEQAQRIIDEFPALIEKHLFQGSCRKLGIDGQRDGDNALIAQFQQLLAEHRCDYTLAHARLTSLADPDSLDWVGHHTLFEFPKSFADWISSWQQRRELNENPQQSVNDMLAANPLVIARNHRIQAVIDAAEHGDFEPFHALNTILQSPFGQSDRHWEYAAAAKDHEKVTRTFCGT